MPRWLALALIGIVLILAGVFLAPLVPAAGTFLYYALTIIGGVVVLWAIIVLIMSLSGGHPRV